MNLHGLVRAFIPFVNADTPAVYLQSIPNTVDAAGNQTAQFAPAVPLMIQVQAADEQDLQHVNNLNMQGLYRTVYTSKIVNGVVRTNQQGGDMFQFPLEPGGVNKNWLVVKVLEPWQDWTKVLVCLQQ